MAYTILSDTFTGTAGASLAGHAPGTAYSGRTWDDMATRYGGLPNLFFRTGGSGLTSAGAATGLCNYDLTGAPANQTINVTFSSSASDQYLAIQPRKSADGTNNLAIEFTGDNGGQVILSKTLGGTRTQIGASAFVFAPATVYTLAWTMVTSGGSTAHTVTITPAGGSTTTHFNAVANSDAALQSSGNLLMYLEVAAPGAGNIASLAVTTPSAANLTITGPGTLDGTTPGTYTGTLDGPAPDAGLTLTPATTVFTGTASPTTVGYAAGATVHTFTELNTTAGTGNVGGTCPGVTVVPRTGVVASAPASTVSGVSVSPPTATVAGGATQAFTATVAGTNSPSQSVTWGASAGSFNGATFTAPSATGSIQTITVTATSVQDGTKSGTATVTVPATTGTAFTLTGPSSGYAANASGNFTVTPNGNTSGTFTPTPVSGVTYNPATLTWTNNAVAKTFTATKATAGAITVNGTFSDSLTPPSSVTYTFVARTLAASPSSLAASTTTTATFTGGGTKWQTSAPTFAASGVTGVSVGSVTVLSDTSATAPVTTGPATGTVTYTDSTTAATATQSVVAAPTGKQLSVYYPAASLATVYFVILRAGKLWNGSAFATISSGSWASYAVAGADAAGVGVYLADFPPAIAGGDVTVLAYLKAGSTPAATDAAIGQLNAYWDGTNLGSGGSGSGSGGSGSDWLALDDAILDGETGRQSFRKVLANLAGEWDITSVQGWVLYKLGGVEVYRIPRPTPTGRAGATNAGGL